MKDYLFLILLILYMWLWYLIRHIEPFRDSIKKLWHDFCSLFKKKKDDKVFFISGHRDITNEEFELLYAPQIKNAISNYNAYFIMGDYEGVDYMAQNYLIDTLRYDLHKITVCHMHDTPRFMNNNVINVIPNFKDDEDRDKRECRHSEHSAPVRSSCRIREHLQRIADRVC